MAYIELKNITKTFFGVKALSNVSLSIEKGEVHAIVGENGAGKSTIMKVLGGMYFADSGEIYIAGKKCSIHSVTDALKAGVAVVYQELNLMPDLTVAENIYLHSLPKKAGIMVNKDAMNRQAQELLDEMDVDFKATDLIGMLSVSEQQMVEIAKALSLNADIIVMDEPTASLNDKEVETLYRLIRKLKQQNKTIIYISHRLKEIFDLSDQLSILRDGTFVGTYKTNSITRAQMVEKMVGREVKEYYTTSDHEPGEVVLEVKGLCKEGMYEKVSFSLRKGELLGVAGLMGSFREEIVKTLYGLIQADSGEILLHGRKINPKNPEDAIRNGIGFVTEDRKTAGIFGLMSVRENLTINVLKRLRRVFWIPADREQELLDTYQKNMNMKFSGYFQKINSLSGGNQQKILLARALASGCEVLIMLEPTRGIDVGAKAEIYGLLEELAKQGMAILVVSSDLPEIIANCHRTITVFQGKISGNIGKDKMEEAFILQCATGNKTCLGGGEA
ncbi:monosaccharide ABC transporter ATP-binding protein, CUT2 family [Lachnospiraceae bacterium NLAE-zl-G231]|nr:monosaccharide ABC transporter ATP-binding protein, CUT2 family [Lachnospiraceae bacterium NLAE-zl-G231]